MIGRRREFAEIGFLLDRAAAGSGGFLVILGAAGSGRITLAEAAAGLGRRRGVRRGPREGNRRRLRSSGVDAGDQRPRRPGPLRRSAAGRGRGVGPRPGRPVAGVGIRTAHRDRRHRPGRTGCNRAPVGHRFPAGQRAGGGGGDHRCSLGAGPGAAAGRSDRGRAGRASRRSTRRGRACVVAGLGRAPRSGPWPNSGE